jgi:exonuclease VII large subunit
MNWWTVIQSVLGGLLLLLMSVALETARRGREERKKELREIEEKIAQAKRDFDQAINSLRREMEANVRDNIKSVDKDIEELYKKAEVEVADLQTRVEVFKEKNDECHRAMDKDVQMLRLEMKDLERDIPRNLHAVVMEQQREIERLRAKMGTRNGD